MKELKSDMLMMFDEIRQIDIYDTINTLGTGACAILLVLSNNNPVATNLLWMGILDGVISFYIHQRNKDKNKSVL